MIFQLSKSFVWRPLPHLIQTECKYPFEIVFEADSTHGAEVVKLISDDPEKDPPQFPAFEMEHVVMGQMSEAVF